MTETDFLDALEIDVPETMAIMDEHLADHDTFLLHLLVADLRRYAIQSFDAGQRDVFGRLLGVFDRALREGTDDVKNAVAVSFVEDAGWWDPATRPFIEAWPAGLRAEAHRQRGQRQ